MHSKVVLVVSRTHWRCVSCRLLHSRMNSIDQHLRSTHPALAGPSPQTQRTECDTLCCHSDNEVDRTFYWKDVFPPSKTLSFQPENNYLLKTDSQQPNSIQTISLRSSNTKQRKSRNRKQHMDNQIEEADSDSLVSCRASNEDYKPDSENNNYNGHDKTARKSSNKMKSQSLSMKSVVSQKSNFIDNGKETRKRKSKDNGKDIHVSIGRKLVNKTTSDMSKDSLIKTEVDEEQHASGVNKEIAHSHSEIKSSGVSMKENVTKAKRVKAAIKHDVNKSSKQIDKSNLATECVPWLLDSGRKAGDKVTKQFRRTLRPEEKQALRKLYGVCLSSYPGHRDSGIVMEGTTGHNSKEVDLHVSGHLSLLPYSGITPSLKITHEGSNVASHRHIMLNMFSHNTQDFFLNKSHTLDSSYPDCDGIDNQQYPHSGSQPPEVYSSAYSTLSERSNLSSSQPYVQTTPPGLATGGIDTMKHIVSQEYITSFSQRPVPSSAAPLCPSTKSSETNIRYTVATDSVTSSHSAKSSSCSSTTEDLNTKPDPTIDFRGSVPQSEEMILVGESQGNQCTVCKQMFQSLSDFENHQKGGCFENVECKRCQSIFHGLHELNLHVFSDHEIDKQGFCFTCNGDTIGMENLEKHVHRHAFNCEKELVDVRFHNCALCGEEMISSYATMRTHYYQHHAAHVCRVCYHFFQDAHTFREHGTTHGGVPVYCTICGSKFQTEEDLNQHAPCPEDIWAEDGKGHQCSKCGSWCPNRAVVEAHRRQHRSQEDVQAYRQGAKVGFPCTSCEKVFKNKHACRRHVKMVHEGVVCYSHYCEYCGKGFLTKGHMRDHIALHHLNIKRYRCEYCNQQFVCAPTLRRHMRKEHTKHKPYACQHCGERFFEKIPLQRHLTQHTGLAPFICEQCGKCFYTKHSFSNHSSTHSSVKDFVCTGCQKGFTRKYNLQAHIKICKML